MITKTITPDYSVESSPQVGKMVIEYRIFRLLVYRKVLYTPFYFGFKEYDGFISHF
jgi:hypothetical protein